MKQSACSHAMRQFYRTTTLHGFKYLCSKYYADRIGWLICCCASACCAGVLCAVLWERFLEVPALLTLHDLRGQEDAVKMPLVAVCPPAETIAYLFQKKLLINTNVTGRLQTILNHVLRRKDTNKEHLVILEEILFKNNLTLPEALMQVMPPCHSIVKNCRWQSIMIPCGKLFERELTEWGVCCLSRPKKLKIGESRTSRLEAKRNLQIAVQCSDQPTLNGCEVYTKFNGEEWVEPMILSPGYNYLAQVTFTSVVDSDPDKFVEGTCSTADGYSKSRCLLKCKEKSCGCSDPLRSKSRNEDSVPPPCLMTQMSCLRRFNFENITCKCLPSCKKVSTFLVLESSPMNAFIYTHNEIYAGLNETASSVLLISIRISGSRIFVVNPTETWITLLSSLGGVFNMFLGVGLFSALEILFLLFVRLPIAIRRSTEIQIPSSINNLYC
nr:sodium channel protein Nach-like [Vanessa tameamea]